MGKVICKQQSGAEKWIINTDRQSKETSLVIKENVEWRLYRGNSAETIDMSHPIAEGSGVGEYKLDVSKEIRSYFSLVTDRGNIMLANRRLPLDGCYNFRDIGGYRTKEGRCVKWGMIFRADDLSALTETDMDYLSHIPVQSVVDFRSAQEIAQQPDKIPPSVKDTYPYSILPGDLMHFVDKGIPSLEEMDALMQQMNRLLVTDKNAVEQFRKLFELLQSDSEVPLVYHCTAGKDRTGIASALILFALGVDDCTVIADYLLSNQYLKGKYDAYIKKYPALEPLLDVRERYLSAGLEQIARTYGSVDNFIRGTLGVDVKLMRNKYLYSESAGA